MKTKIYTKNVQDDAKFSGNLLRNFDFQWRA